jgi:hypothetical protein
MTKYTATCPECGQRWHAWAKRPDMPCPECHARERLRNVMAWLELGIDCQIGTLTFEEEPENISK